MVGLAAVAAYGCQPRLTAAPSINPTLPVRDDIAVVRPQQDAHVAVSITGFDGSDVSRYLGGWGVRPKLPQIAVEPGNHTFEVSYFDLDSRTPSRDTATLVFCAYPGHLYTIRAGTRGMLSRLSLTLARARNPSWKAWVEDMGLAEDLVEPRVPAAPAKRGRAIRNQRLSHR